jgi:hypothetical protein
VADDIVGHPPIDPAVPCRIEGGHRGIGDDLRIGGFCRRGRPLQIRCEFLIGKENPLAIPIILHTEVKINGLEGP